MKRCPFCAETIQSAAVVCPHCTHPIVDIGTTGFFTTILVVLSVGSAFIGGVMLLGFTTGIGMLLAACFLAILARVAQASAYRDRDRFFAGRVRSIGLVDREQLATEAIVQAATKDL